MFCREQRREYVPALTTRATSRLDNLLPLSNYPGLCVLMTFGLWISVLPLLVVAAACVRVLIANPR